MPQNAIPHDRGGQGTVAYFRHQKSGCWYYRILQKMAALERAGVPTRMIELDSDLTNEEFDQITTYQFYGIYPFSLEKVFKFLKEAGKKIIYDCDDAMNLIEETNPFYYAVKKDAWSFLEILPYADEVTVSTPKMAEYVKSYKPDANVTVVPNTYAKSEWVFARPDRGGIRIGFAGSPTHLPDLLKVLPAIKNLQAKYNVTFILMGLGPYNYETSFKHLKAAGTDTLRNHALQVEELLKEIKFEWVPHVDFEQYFPTLINLSLDYGLCPLSDTPFNAHRSPVKALEYTLAGALALASNMPGYSQDLTSVLTLDDQWETKLEYCIMHPHDVALQKQVHLTWAKENRNVDDQVPLLKQIYLG